MSARKRFNFCDIIIIFALLTIILSFAFRKPIENIFDTLFFQTNISYTVESDDSHFNTSVLKNGDVLYNSSNEAVGTIESVTSGDKTRIIINTSGKADKTGVYIGNKMFIAPGLNIDLHTEQGYFFNCLVKKVQTY